MLALVLAITIYFPWQIQSQAIGVAWCESRGVVTASNGTDIGVFQVDPDYWGDVPSDVDGQVRQAFFVWAKTGDFREWPVCGRIPDAKDSGLDLTGFTRDAG